MERFEVDGLVGEIEPALRPADLAPTVRRLVDPAAAVETLHWGRNYLYRARIDTASGPLDVVVKQFREDRLKERWRRRRAGSKGRRSWRIARQLEEAGLAITPRPVMMAESREPGGPSFYVCEHLDGSIEARYLLRAAAAGEQRERFPEIDFENFLDRLGGLIRRFHDAGFQHRDLSVGNVLLEPRPDGGRDLYLIDLNRARRRRRVNRHRRLKDLCRLALFRPEHRALLLAGYLGRPPGRLWRSLLTLYQGAFESKGSFKKPLKAVGKAVAKLAPRRAHAHIPASPEGASARDRVVWDELSDQPHQHAGRFAKLAVRLADGRAHAEELAVVAGALPRIWRRYRRLSRRLAAPPAERQLPWRGVGVALRPYPEDPEALLAAIDELAVEEVLLRLHPWQQEHGPEEELARELAARGHRLAFALPQNRELVNDPARWRASVEELVERFSPFGDAFQVGQAINRSKWGIWRLQEYVELAQSAIEVLRARPGLQVVGPAVIDFEHHVTAAVLNLRRQGLRFDVVSSLLYVDRRGAPENRQTGFDTVDKVALLKAIADTGRNGPADGRCWITEVNWPLWEGPHSPAGKGVSVDEEAQADYLVRYYLLTLATGLVERVYWWQLVARGYGLMVAPEAGRLQRRPAFRALAAMQRLLAGCTALGPVGDGDDEGTRQLRLRRPSGGELLVAWSAGTPDDPPRRLTLPRPAAAAFDRDGAALVPPAGTEAEVRSAPLYLYLEEE